MTPEDNIEKFKKEIIQQAENDAKELLSQAKTHAEEITSRAQEHAASIKEKIVDQANRDAERIRGQAIATTQLKARNMQLEAREKLLVDVFQAAREKVDSIQQRNDYQSIVEQLAEEAITKIEAKKVILRADKVTSKILSDSVIKNLSDKLDIKIELGEVLDKGTGLIAETENGHLTFDNLLETRLDRMESELRSPVHHLLLGESL